MPETLTEHIPGDQPKWTWANVMADLRDQGHVDGVWINPLSISPDGTGCGGEYQGNRFFITWIKDAFLLLTMQKHSEELVRGFTKVVEYDPFCKYSEENGLVTVEWDKVDPEKRYRELENQGKKELTRIVPQAPTTQ